MGQNLFDNINFLIDKKHNKNDTDAKRRRKPGRKRSILLLPGYRAKRPSVPSEHFLWASIISSLSMGIGLCWRPDRIPLGDGSNVRVI
jgi:hypothetical protein